MYNSIVIIKNEHDQTYDQTCVVIVWLYVVNDNLARADLCYINYYYKFLFYIIANFHNQKAVLFYICPDNFNFMLIFFAFCVFNWLEVPELHIL